MSGARASAAGSPPPPPPLLLAAVFLLSAAAIGYEILLMRLFSIVQWHHFAAMIISLALLGYGASGTLLALARERLLPAFWPAFAAGAGLFGIAAPGAFALAQRLPFNPLEVVWDAGQLGRLAGVYLILSVPFFAAATSVGLALVAFRGRIGRVYGTDLGGAGAGAAGVVALLFVLAPAACLPLLGALGLLAAGLAAWTAPGRGSRPAAALLLAAAGCQPWLWPAAWLAPRPSPYKGLSLALRLPGAEVVAERSGPLGALAVVASPQIPLRHAPGLSLAAPVGPPEQLALFTDADGLTAIDRFDGDLAAVAYRDYLTSSLPYHLLDRPRVLVLGAGGGAEVLTALYHRAPRVDAVEVNRQVAELVGGELAPFSGGLYVRPGVALHVAEARGFVAGRGRGPYDLIQLGLLDAPGAAASGAHALAEGSLYTVEAFTAYLDRLAPGGLLAVTGWLEVPPRAMVKLLATAREALARRGVADPGRQVAVVRSLRTATLLIKRGPFVRGEIDALRRFCRERWFDLGYYPGMARREADRYSLWEEPYLYDAAVAILGSEGDRFRRRYKFHVAAATDDRPFFFRFFKWRVLPELLRLSGRGGTHLLEWSYLVHVATLVQALAAGLVLVVAPLALRRRRLSRRVTLRGGGYFSALGLAFLFLEIASIHRLSLFLAHPLYAAALVLAAFLVFAGLGSALSAPLARRLGAARGDARGRSGVVLAPAAVAVLALLYGLLMPPLLGRLMPAPEPLKVVVALAMLAPLAFAMGMPFPLGLERVGEREPAFLPWAWAINGCASVVSAVLASLLAIHLGFAAVAAAAAALYGAAALAIRRL